MRIIDKLAAKSCLILGFGREGVSTYKYLRSLFPEKELVVADGNENLDCTPYQHDTHLRFILGGDYLQAINQFELVIKSPGISLKDIQVSTKITSQTDIFLQLHGHQTIGITGTKGKSTTTTLIYHILKQHLPHVLLAGNMGIPLFDIVPEIRPDSVIVCEFSSHQLEYLTKGPHVGILLNLFEEHLDHYKSYLHYQMAKLNIGLKQNISDYFIYNLDDLTISKLLATHEILSIPLPFSTSRELEHGIFLDNSNHILEPNFGCAPILLEDDFPLKGEHNKKNMMVAALVAMIYKLDSAEITAGLKSFSPLPHRLEFVGTKNGIDFYNDSISTIPQATIEALNTLPKTSTLILGGFDRGIDYSILIDFLETHSIQNLIFTGEAGKRMLELVKNSPRIKSTLYFESEYDQIMKIAFEVTQPGSVCLLSPAASSYDKFKNFEHRGDFFKELIFKTQNL